MLLPFILYTYHTNTDIVIVKDSEDDSNNTQFSVLLESNFKISYYTPCDTSFWGICFLRNPQSLMLELVIMFCGEMTIMCIV